MSVNPSDMENLMSLLIQQQESSGETMYAASNTSALAPSTIPQNPAELFSSSKKMTEEGSRPYGKPKKSEKPTDPKAIWTEEEIENEVYFELPDGREEAKFEILYKQQVGAEEVFFGMEGKTPSIASCDAISIRVYLPEEEPKTIVSDLAPKILTLKSQKYKLTLPLPKFVHDKQAVAEWDPTRETLTVTAPIDLKRTFDESIPEEEELQQAKYEVI
ncbi:putative dynein assembly factor 6, axonemal [Monocercomonoides exilis]|uniref:putative dynein assembly factor 6, axonemal n=1 Tax=Monocercomonoides exilis TaxID=2049356 RepID=UPI00355940AC|nr:putative dynein assembly factor 6, axonemal [Monocercomonoides exilis]|eukprot:MONOS_12963.1-p1 / transcript=MONOS_12963.1 / gene=MONOS_12963 / organism=Monocercomonoides_exilis_PA203 / gene_product=unspecified product / transcript_product=unspecified product / location=Mono_scaffold00760:8629-9418(+) / protein_length=216 / sequence_SO=supercontig / SO=protein_coding / is_pseudo=false